MLGTISLAGVLLTVGRALMAGNIREAQPAPKFVLKEHGHAVKLADFKAKALLVCFVATGDEPSHKQLALLNGFVDRYGGTNLTVLALAIDQRDPDALKKFAEQEHLRYAVHSADYDLIESFGGLSAVPTTYVIDKDRDIIDKFVGITETNALDADVQAIMKQ